MSEPVEVAEPPITGDSSVDEVTAGVAQAVAGGLAEQVAAFERAHRALQDRLADVEG